MGTVQLQVDGHRVDYLDGIAAAAPYYDAFLVDVWGVLHDSARTYPGALECLEELQRLGKRVILLSNAARRVSVLEEEFSRLGITETAYERIVSSGELTWQSFARGDHPLLSRLGMRYFLLGSEKYRLTEGLPLQAAASPAEADFLLAISVAGSPSSTAAEEPVLLEAAERGLVMVCANPDKVVVRDGTMGIAPGAVAARYEELGGKVIYFGKPYEAIYSHCFAILADIDRHRIAAVGDGLITDIAGAAANGLDSVLVAGGIHAAELAGLPSESDGLAELCRQEHHYPTMVVPRFSWNDNNGENQ